MTIAHVSTPVVVLKLEHYGSLGIIRSLGRAGVAVYGVDHNVRAPGFQSRYCSGKFLWDLDNSDHEDTAAFLLDVGKKIGKRSILIPTSDEMAMFVARYADVLRQWYLFPHMRYDLVASLCSKKAMFYLAKAHGIPTAETVFPQTRYELLSYLDEAVFPIMLKGIDGRRLEQRTGKKMIVVHNTRELLEKYELMEDPTRPNLMLQEYIPGGDDEVWMFNGYFNLESECLVGFTGKKLRQNPVHTGMTSLGVCLHNDAVAAATKFFMKAIGYHGIVDIGFRYDKRDGLYKVLDVNPRVGATFRLFVAKNGLDVVRALYLDLTDQPVPQSQLSEGRKWFVEDKDLKSCYDYFRDGSLGMFDWVRSFRNVCEAGYFARDDLVPFFSMVKEHVREEFCTMLTRILRKLSIPPPSLTHEFARPSRIGNTGNYVKTGGIL